MITVPLNNNSYAENLAPILIPENYTAIYARHSIDRKQSVSNDAQFKICREIAKSKNLIVYKEYGDQGSGVTMPPESRKEFQKLFVDAKSGLFKTIIIWKIDRLSRNSADFYDICNKFESLGITIIFGDMLGFDNIPKMYKSFMQNTFISLAQLDPELTRERANASRSKKRQLGIYSPTKCPFGYIRKKPNDCLDLIDCTIIDYSKIKSYYVKDKFKSRLIKIIYSKYISSDNVEIKDIYKVFKELLNKFNTLNDINTLDDIINIISESEEISLPGLTLSFEVLTDYNIEDLKIIIKDSFEFLSKHTNIKSILTNTYYCKKFALNTDKTYPTIIKDSNNNFIFNDSDFITCINFDEIIPLSTFTIANIKYHSKQNKQIKPTKFLYKGLFKCKRCNKPIISYDNEKYICSCNNYTKSQLLSLVTKSLIADGLLNYISERIKFKRKEIDNKVNEIHLIIQRKEETKSKYCLAYLNTASKANLIILNNISKEIKLLKKELEDFLLKDYPLNNLLFNIENLKDTSAIEELIVNYFYINPTNSELFFNQLINLAFIKDEVCDIEYK